MRALSSSVLIAFCAACAKNESAPIAPTIERNASPTTSSRARVYTVDAAGKTTIDNDAPLEHFKGTTSAAAGELTIDAHDLAQTRGEVKIDLTTLRSHTFPDEEKNKTQSEHARTWLEAVVDEHVNDTMRWAVFRIASVEDVDPSRDAFTLPHVTKDEVITRTVTLTARGDLFIHGRAAPKKVKLRAELSWPRALDSDPPTSIVVQTVDPLSITLADHEIVPRDMFGKEAKAAMHLLGTKVGPVADVRLDLAMR